ncbi:MAG: type I secretion system permease/ATPase [Rhodocyclaceae bacterium]|nr:MAG: type I secretion system permease/ATPase [Rhodocyclaceae bacterium]
MKTPSFFQRSELAATLWTFRREFAVCVVFTIVVNILMLTPTLYMLQVFDRVMLSGSEFTLTALTLVMLFFFAVMAFSEWSRSRLLVRTGVKLDEQLNSRIFNASFESYLNQLGRSPAQAFSDLTNVRQFLTGQGLFAFMDAPWTPIYMLVLYMLHPMLGLLSVVFSALLVALAYLSHRLTIDPLDKAMEAGMQVSTYVHSKLRNAEVIESMGMLDDLRRLWQVRHQRYLGINQNAQDLAARIQALTKFLRYTQQSLALAGGALLVIQGELTPGGMIAANVLMGRASAPIDLMVSTWKSSISAHKAFLRLEELLRLHPPRDAGLVHDTPQGHMRIENLVATAPGRTQPILKGLSADFPAGQIIAVIGPSGSGKSTLARALVGIWPYVEGKVLIDGEPIQSWNRDELGPFIGYLPQDIELFEGTIAENIARFGQIDPEKVILAAGRAGVHDMILRFPRGYDTSMGEAGNLLSGGQRQRIGLARAMYGDPSLIVLDEPNSNLDDMGEAALVKAVQDLKQQGKSVFLITHRMSIIGVADRILVLHDGAIQIYGPTQDVIAALQPKPAAQGEAGGHSAPAPQPV